jgi:DNA-binding transcriptional MerR regulator
MSGSYSIGALSRLSNVNIETIRYYEKVQLLPAADRAGNGYRQYDDAAAERLAFVRRARQLGFAIDEIRELLTLARHPDRACSNADRMTRAHLDDIRGKILDLQRMQRALQQVENCRGRTAEHCELLKALVGSRTLSKLDKRA